MGGGDDESEEATHASRDLFMGRPRPWQGHDQATCRASATGLLRVPRARQSSGIAEGVCVAPMGAVADASKGKLPAPGGRRRGYIHKKHLLAFDHGLAQSRRETPNIGFDIQRLLLERS